jgi:uridylate kinase
VRTSHQPTLLRGSDFVRNRCGASEKTKSKRFHLNETAFFLAYSQHTGTSSASSQLNFGVFMTAQPAAAGNANASHPVRYKRVLIKISGEALMGEQSFGQDLETIQRICSDVKEVADLGVQVCLVVGGGNIFRGMSGAAKGMERSSADYMGMLATILNALAIQNTLDRLGADTRVMSALEMKEVCEPYIRRRALRHLERGRIVIFAGGIGNPYFTTDTTAALRASEMNCEVLMKGTQVSGVFDADPKSNPNAKRYETLTYHDVLSKDLRVMDAAAISLARENSIPILVFSIHKPGSFARVIAGEGEFTKIYKAS